MRRNIAWIDGWVRVSFVMAWSATLMFIAGIAVFFYPLADCWIARRLWAPVIFKAFRSRVIVDGERLDLSSNYVFVMNHQSSLDIPAAFLAVAHPFRFMAKKEYMWFPFLNFYLWRTRSIVVDRSNPRKARRSLDTGARRLREGLNLLVFPEGTRTTDGRIQAFKRGAFMLAQAAGTPVVPISINGTAQITPKRSLSYRPGTVRIRVGEAIDTRDFTEDSAGVDQLRDAARRRISQLYQEIGGPGSDAGVVEGS
ncbi:MAG: 1-acyl-sn-glycerol-3-phosphate acyltransferase [Gemmatimonadota bacterium]|nr:MAG: 1-acyl-sn-glycerol-3-phosphate acyltransferase [Gemmatimonadota bacterium]